MSLRDKSIVGCFPDFVFQFTVVKVLAGLRKQFVNNFVFPAFACAAGFNDNNNKCSLFNLLIYENVETV